MNDGRTAATAIAPHHTPTLLEAMGCDPHKDVGTWAGSEFCASIELYLAKQTSHPLVQKYGWGNSPSKAKQAATQPLVAA